MSFVRAPPSSLVVLTRGVAIALACAALLVCRSGAAHAASDGYLTLVLSDGPTIEGRWDVAVRDLAAALPLDPEHPGGGDVRADQVLRKRDDILAFVLSRLTIRADGSPCPTTPGELAFTDHGGRDYVALRFTARCVAPPRVVFIGYNLLFDRDPQHRGLVRIEDGAKSRSIVFSPGFRHDEFARSERNPLRELGAAVRSGVNHIASGPDHLLFLLVLLVPSVLRREGNKWHAVSTFREAAVAVAKIVTAFTVAHSLTLSASVLGLVRLSPRFIEPAIAASVVFAALENVLRPMSRGRWRVAFVLGLLHGFGFSAALLDLGLHKEDLAITLFGFNVGVELGQLVVVVLFLPLAFGLRRSPRYRPVVVDAGSVAVAIVASVWFVQRLT
jgi:hypothetical protein